MRRWQNKRQFAGNFVAALLFGVMLLALFDSPLSQQHNWQQALSYARTHRVVTTHLLALDEWQPFQQLETPTFMGQITNAHAHGYNMLYVELNPPTSSAAQNTYANQLSSFVTKLSKQGMQVGALGGDPSWAQPANYADASQLLAFTTSYNETHQPQLAALQYDVEPYLDSTKTTSITALTGLVASLNQQPRAIPVGYSIPFWAIPAECTTTQCAGFKLLQTIGAKQGSFVNVMAYRSTPFGTNGSIALSQPILTAVQQLSQPLNVYIGQDISKGDATVSFYHSGSLDLAAALYVIDRNFSPQEDFAGSVVNDGQYLLGSIR